MTKPTLVEHLRGSSHRGSYGVGSDLQQLTPPVKKVWSDFSKGFAAVVAPEDTPEGASWDAVDMEVDRRERLVRAPGVVLLEALTYAPVDVMLHGNLDVYSELVIFAPPYVGVKSTGVTTWTNVGLTTTRPVAAALYADVLLITDGRKAWSRQQAAAALVQELLMPPGEDIAVFGNRVLVGGGLFNGNIEVLSVQWNDASGDYKNWGGLGSGVEFLLSGGPESDRLIAMRAMNFSLLAILTRHAIWVGNLTGNGLAPFKFSIRVKGVGAVARRTVQTTEFGVLFLSDDGVRAFDGNASVVLSDAINSELLPLTNDGRGYSSSYDASTHRYYLYTPSGPTYVLDLNKHRWYKWSRTFNGGVTFPVQVVQETWATAVGTWGTEVGSWADLILAEGAGRHLIFAGTQLGVETPGVETSFGAVFYPRWTMPLTQPEDFLRLFRTDTVEVRVQGVGVVRANLPGNTGEFISDGADMTTLAPLDSTYSTLIHTGLGLGLQLEIRSGSPKISRAVVHGRYQGERQ